MTSNDHGYGEDSREERGGRRGGRRGGKFSKFGRAQLVEPEEPLNYKNLEYLSKFVLPTGKIVGRRRTGFSGQNQRRLAVAIKRARLLSLLPYVGRS